MIRKIQEVGGSTYLVSIPKKWVKELGIEKGEEVELTKDGNSIVLIRREKEKKSRVAIEMEKGLVSRRLLAAYLSGVKKIEIVSKTKIPHSSKMEIKEMLKKLAGIEITEERKNSIILEDLLDEDEVDIRKLIKRAYGIARSMHEDVVHSLFTNDKDLAKEVISRDDELDRIYFLAVRQLKSGGGYMKGVEFMDLRLLIKNIESIGDSSARIGKNVLELKEGIDLREISREICNFHKDSFSAFLRGDIKTAEKLRSKYHNTLKKIRKFHNKKNGPVLDELEGILNCGLSISDLVT